jgi:hypothetical protein
MEIREFISETMYYRQIEGTIDLSFMGDNGVYSSGRATNGFQVICDECGECWRPDIVTIHELRYMGD